MEGLLFVLGAYLLPSIIALGRGHPNSIGIILLNVLVGWTLIRWVAALVWSVLAFAKAATSQVPVAAALAALESGPVERITELKRLLDSGAITQREFDHMKAAVLGSDFGRF